MKDISGLFKNELGPTNYSLLADMFGLARETTATKHASQLKLDPGLNVDAIDLAAQTLKGLPINEASDGARCLRYLESRKLKDSRLVLVDIHGIVTLTVGHRTFVFRETIQRKKIQMTLKHQRG